MTIPMAVAVAVQALSDPGDFARELVTAGFRDPHIEHVTHEYLLETARLAEPDTLFGTSPDWTNLSEAEKAAVVAEVWTSAANRAVLPIPSTALIATARR